MSTLEWIIVGGGIAFPIAFLIWLVVKRKMVFYNVSFTAETVWKNFQGAGKQGAMEYVDYLKEEEETDESGEKKGDGAGLAPNPPK